MATIGTFTASENGFTGSIKTLTLNIKAKFTASEKDNDKAPDYRIFAGSTEFGAAWKKTVRDSDREYLSVRGNMMITLALGATGSFKTSRRGNKNTASFQ